MKVKDIIEYYKYLKSQSISPRHNWSYYADTIDNWLNKEIEYVEKKGEN